MFDQLEAERDLTAVLGRFRSLRLLPVDEPDWLAARTVAAVKSGKPHVRSPRRMGISFWLNAGPSRLTELLLRGVATGPRA